MGLDQKEEVNIISRFNAERNDQYQVFLDKCKDYMAEIKAPTSRSECLEKIEKVIANKLHA